MSDCGLGFLHRFEGGTKFLVSLWRDNTEYAIHWRYDNTTAINIHMWRDNVGSTRMLDPIDHWLPFDITLDTLKVYLTFS